ncbi:Aste57867_11624 [Aphanomyces stellatus]|uniref:Aste57867_11624 protein n=1 Tax=Aphanomyces stellatus TaxID=120398 RepID=A0A485KTI6_9STRA|nr:hypothetical protein As57867_011581 [Aphanomyces stellatus]VFT88482.1 Aste57867_11624 [Aphanomyces stellatus]
MMSSTASIREILDQVSPSVAPFLVCLFEILTKEDASVIAWCDDGKAFAVYDYDAMERHILPTYFRHSKYSSFQRQLNYFGFRKLHKTKDAVTLSHYRQPNFVQNDPSRLLLIHRKTNRARASKVHRTTATSILPQHCDSSSTLSSAVMGLKQRPSAYDPLPFFLSQISTFDSPSSPCEVSAALDLFDPFLSLLEDADCLGRSDTQPISLFVSNTISSTTEFSTDELHFLAEALLSF